MKTDKRKLFEAFEKICKIKLINEAFIDKDGNIQDISHKQLSDDEIKEIFKGYIECALWTEEDTLKDDMGVDDNDDEDIEDMDEIEKLIKLQDNFQNKNFISFISDDIDVNSRIDAYKDIKNFIIYAGSDAINEAIEENGLFKLGMDIWLTRNGHGSGFFDHTYDNENELTDAARKLGSVDLYIGDDGKLYFM
jgi:hypothetical protein